jgi:hypothetical protein
VFVGVIVLVDEFTTGISVFALKLLLNEKFPDIVEKLLDGRVVLALALGSVMTIEKLAIGNSNSRANPDSMANSKSDSKSSSRANSGLELEKDLKTDWRQNSKLNLWRRCLEISGYIHSSRICC